MLTTLLGALVQALLKVLPDDIIKESLGELTASIRKKVKESKNKVDDTIVLPILDVLEKQLGL